MAVETKEVLEDVRAGKYEPWICLDTYIVAHLAELLTKMRDEGKAYSGNSPEEWKEVLSNLIRDLEAYDTDDPDAYGRTQDALRYFASHLREFWD